MNRLNLRRHACFGAALCALLCVAFYNRYPLVSWDSGAYIYCSFHRDIPLGRPAIYSVFLLLTHLRITLWGPVVAQGAIVVYVLRSVLETGRLEASPARRDLELLAATAFLTVGTALPWITGLVMTDVFTGVGVLALFQMLAAPLRRRAKATLGALLVLASSVHVAHLPLAAGLLVCALTVGGKARTWRSSVLPAAAACVVASWLLIPAVHWLRTGRASVAEGGHVVLVSRLVSGGIIQKLLAEHCGERDYELCPYQASLHRSLGFYLWNPPNPLPRIGGWRGSQAASWRMIRDCVREYPWLVAEGTLRAAGLQLQTFSVPVDAGPFLQGTSINTQIQHLFPRDYSTYRSSPQQRDGLPIKFFSWLHWWVFVVSAVASAGFFIHALWRGIRQTLTLHAFVWVALLINALIVGAANEPNYRYGARLAWIVPFAVLVSAFRCADARRQLRTDDSIAD